MKFTVPCLHERWLVSSTEVVADYHPLKLEEVLAMIQIACHCDPLKSKEAAAQISEIQVRLNQGIMGMTCPGPNEGEIAARCAKVDDLFMRVIDKGCPLDMSQALLIYELMTFQKKPEDVP